MGAAHQSGRRADIVVGNAHPTRTVASQSEKAQLAAVMDTNEESSRYDEFVAFLNGEFATLDHQSKAYFVAEIGDMIVGFVPVWNSPHIREWVIDGIVVHTAHKRQGVAYHLLSHALSLARTLGGSSVISHIRRDNMAAIRLHRRAGFQRETENYLNSYGEARSGWGWQWRLSLSMKSEDRMLGVS